jgi:hypothetical protein
MLYVNGLCMASLMRRPPGLQAKQQGQGRHAVKKWSKHNRYRSFSVINTFRNEWLVVRVKAG